MVQTIKEVVNMKIKSVDHKFGSILEITEQNNNKRLINVDYWMNLPILNYSELKNPSYLKLVKVSENNNTIEWPDGQDIAPEDLETFSVPIN